MDEHTSQLSDSAHSGIHGQQMKDLELAKYGSGPPAEEPINLDEEALGVSFYSIMATALPWRSSLRRHYC